MQKPLPSSHDQTQEVDHAFSAQAPLFDVYEEHNAILQWMRRQVHEHLDAYVNPGDSILDIGAGTGIDAVYFAKHGHSVHAIDIAEGMIRELKKKAAALNLSHLISVQQSSYIDLGTVRPKKFHHALSNFGGLNCISDLRPVADQIRSVLYPGGKVTLVVMPRICPWELFHAAKGNFSLAFRRLQRNGTVARIEGHQFLTYYHSPSDVIRSFGEQFSVLKLRGLASLSPPPYMEHFPRQFPFLYRGMTTFDEKFSLLPPFNRWADHYILTLQYTP